MNLHLMNVFSLYFNSGLEVPFQYSSDKFDARVSSSKRNHDKNTGKVTTTITHTWIALDLSVLFSGLLSELHVRC